MGNKITSSHNPRCFFHMSPQSAFLCRAGSPEKFNLNRGGTQEKQDRWIQPVFVSEPRPGLCILRIYSSSNGYCAALYVYESCLGAPCHVCLYESGSLCISFVYSGSLVWFSCCCLVWYGLVCALLCCVVPGGEGRQRLHQFNFKSAGARGIWMRRYPPYPSQSQVCKCKFLYM